ncbi:MAG: hypothetical protein ACR2PM_16505 [Hyphomicrobiales bacterium]
MTARLKAAGLCAAALLIGVPAWAQDQSQRYAMKDVEDGILRLDTYTGTVSYCRRKADAWVCESAVDDRTALSEEMTRLEDENASLKKRIAELEKPSGTDQQNSLQLPSDEELDKVMGFLERLMRRFYAFTRSLRDKLEQEQT